MTDLAANPKAGRAGRGAQISSIAHGTAVEAMKDGKEMQLVVDSSDEVKKRD